MTHLHHSAFTWKLLIACAMLVVAWPAPMSTCAQESKAAQGPSKTKPQTVEDLLLFFPSKYPAGDWNPDGLRWKDVYFAADDDTKLHGWFCECAKPRAVLLLLHGNAGHVASRAQWLRHLQNNLRLSVFIFDYRGYGRSEGVPTVDGALRDAKAARTQLRELAKVTDSEIVLMGESLGGAIAVQLAAESAPRALILQSTFSSLRDVADIHYPRLSWLVSRGKLNSVAKIVDYRGPLLQSHGDADNTIPFASGRKLFEAANEPKQFFVVENAGHNNWLTPAYLDELEQFLANLFKDAN